MPNELASTSAFSHVGAKTVCPKCGSSHLRRLPRSGFLEKRIYSFFGYFPWKCTDCRESCLFRMRGQKMRRRREHGEEE